MEIADIKSIREKEARSHTMMYAETPLYSADGWLKKPIKTVLGLFPLFEGKENLRVLDLGSGIGRNAIPIAAHFRNSRCLVECVDILPFAIEKLTEYAAFHGVSREIRGIASSIEAYPIAADTYDLVLGISSLEHMENEVQFTAKLQEINQGIRQNGIACLVINSQVRETDAETGADLPPQFEINMQTQEMMAVLEDIFGGWKQRKVTTRHQEYQIPRDDRESILHTEVVTFVAEKQ